MTPWLLIAIGVILVAVGVLIGLTIALAGERRRDLAQRERRTLDDDPIAGGVVPDRRTGPRRRPPDLDPF